MLPRRSANGIACRWSPSFSKKRGARGGVGYADRFVRPNHQVPIIERDAQAPRCKILLVKPFRACSSRTTPAVFDRPLLWRRSARVLFLCLLLAAMRLPLQPGAQAQSAVSFGM